MMALTDMTPLHRPLPLNSIDDAPSVTRVWDDVPDNSGPMSQEEILVEAAQPGISGLRKVSAFWFTTSNFFLAMTTTPWLVLLVGLLARAQDICESNGLIVMEVETMGKNGAWNDNSTLGGYTGSSYYLWDGENYFSGNQAGKHGLISAEVMVSTVGTYFIQWRSRIVVGNDNTEHNDFWFKVSGSGSTFFGAQVNNGGSIVYPYGGCPKGLTCQYPHGASGQGFFKVFQNTPNKWIWKSATSDHDDHYLLVTFDTPGVYTFQAAGRSYGFALDRMAAHIIPDYGVLPIEDNVASVIDTIQDTSLPETLCSGVSFPSIPNPSPTAEPQ